MLGKTTKHNINKLITLLRCIITQITKYNRPAKVLFFFYLHKHVSIFLLLNLEAKKSIALYEGNKAAIKPTSNHCLFSTAKITLLRRFAIIPVNRYSNRVRNLSHLIGGQRKFRIAEKNIAFFLQRNQMNMHVRHL